MSALIEEIYSRSNHRVIQRAGHRRSIRTFIDKSRGVKMPHGMNITKTEVIPLAKPQELCVCGAGELRRSVPLDKQTVGFSVLRSIMGCPFAIRTVFDAMFGRL